MLAGSFALIYWLSDKAQKQVEIYPFFDTEDCILIPEYDDMWTLQKSAIMAYRTMQALETQGQHPSYSRGFL